VTGTGATAGLLQLTGESSETLELSETFVDCQFQVFSKQGAIHILLIRFDHGIRIVRRRQGVSLRFNRGTRRGLSAA
jgi:hypothetical protein